MSRAGRWLCSIVAAFFLVSPTLLLLVDEPHTALPPENATMRSTTCYEWYNFAPFNPTLRHSIQHRRAPINDPRCAAPSDMLRRPRCANVRHVVPFDTPTLQPRSDN